MNEKDKRKRKGSGCLIGFFGLLVLFAIGGGIGWTLLSKEHREAASLSLDAVDFNRLDDGTYHGVYAGGMYRWRANECDVTVTNGKVTGIQLVDSTDPGDENTDAEMLYDRVIEEQTLLVDTISGATLTSKAYLKSIENALLQAQQN